MTATSTARISLDLFEARDDHRTSEHRGGPQGAAFRTLEGERNPAGDDVLRLPEPEVYRGRLVPRLRVFADNIFVARDANANRLDEVKAPLLELSFDYVDLGRVVRASDTQDRFLSSTREGVRVVRRDHDAERQARRVLETFGAVDVEAFDTIGVPPDIEADYLVHVGGGACRKPAAIR